jgi:hypothetical protein
VGVARPVPAAALNDFHDQPAVSKPTCWLTAPGRTTRGSALLFPTLWSAQPPIPV